MQMRDASGVSGIFLLWSCRFFWQCHVQTFTRIYRVNMELLNCWANLLRQGSSAVQ